METPESIRSSLFPGEWVSLRPVRRLSSHPNQPTVLPQFTGIPVHLHPFWPSHGPTGLYNDCKRSEADGPHKGSQTSQIPGRLADQSPISGESTSEHSDRGRPDSVLGQVQVLVLVLNYSFSGTCT